VDHLFAVRIDHFLGVANTFLARSIFSGTRTPAPNADFANQWVLATGGLTEALERDILW
jgi:hypothetical protein